MPVTPPAPPFLSQPREGITHKYGPLSQQFKGIIAGQGAFVDRFYGISEKWPHLHIRKAKNPTVIPLSEN
jgi:hypothetical protein